MKNAKQLSPPPPSSYSRPRGRIMQDVRRLVAMHAAGQLGGAEMPEDVHPPLARDSAELLHYLTLPMALNYQRDSYALWRAATATFEDPATRAVFDPRHCASLSVGELSALLTRHRLALQPNRHALTWHVISETICAELGGDVRNLLTRCGRRTGEILRFIQGTHKKGFPYLSGPKISNYWLYVVDSYTTFRLEERELLSVAPDTHVLQASLRLGLVEGGESGRDDNLLRVQVAAAWRELLAGTGISPIDVHTPLWLWSRGSFVPIAG